MRVIGYFLIGPNQDKAEQEIDERRAALEAFCSSKNHTLVDVYHDIAGKKQPKPNLKQLLVEISQAGKGFLILIPNTTTIGHSLEDAISTILDLHRLNSSVMCLDGNNPDPLQNALLTFQKEGKGERIRSAMRAKAFSGMGLGKPPIGYVINDDGRLEISKEEAKIVRWIYHLYTNDQFGVRKISQSLNEDKIVTRNNVKWSMVRVRDILRNKAYVGTYSRFGSNIVSNHPSIISIDTYKDAERKLAKGPKAKQRYPREPFLLSGLLECGDCENKMIGSTKHQKYVLRDGKTTVARYRYYQCSSRTNRNVCKYHTWKTDDLEKLFLAKLSDAVPKNKEISVPTKTEAAQKSDNNIDLYKLVRSASTGTITLNDLQLQLNLLKKISKINTESLPLLQKTYNLDAQLQNDNWINMGFQDKQDLLRAIVKKATLIDSRIDITLNV